MSTGSQPAKTEQVNKVELPAWVNAASGENYNLAKEVANRPLEQFGGPMVASPSGMTTSAYDMIKGILGQNNPLFAKAEGALDKSSGLQDKATRYFDRAASTLDATQPLYDKAISTLDATDPLYAKAAGSLDKSSGVLDQARGVAEGALPLYDEAAGSFRKAGGNYDEAAGIYRGTAGPLDITNFLNPYTDEVEKRAVANANTAQDRNLLAISDKAKAAGAFGGSRAAIESAVARSEGTREIGDLTAALRKAGIDFATETALADRTGRQNAAAGLINVGKGNEGAGTGILNTASGVLGASDALGRTAAGMRETAAGYGNTATGLLSKAAGIGNVASGIRDTATGLTNAGSGVLNAAGSAGNTATGLLGTAAGRTAANNSDITNLLSAGAMETGDRQKVIDAAIKQFYEKRDYPIEALNLRLAALGMSPYGKTETGTKTSTAEQLGPDWATIGLGAGKTAVSALPYLAMLSDRDMKTDIEKITDGPIPLYSYRYKNDPKTYPKVVGPMAQDIKKVVPSAVKKVGKRMVVDMSNLMEALA